MEDLILKNILRYSLVTIFVLALAGCRNEASSDELNLNTNNTTTETQDETQVDMKENPQSKTNEEETEDTKSSDDIKITVDNATEEQLKKYDKANLLELSEDGANLLLLPQEKITDFSISYVQYDATSEKFQDIDTIYTIDELSPDIPLIIKMTMPDIPNIKASYTVASGMKQSVIIAESGKDGSLYLIEQEEVKGLEE